MVTACWTTENLDSDTPNWAYNNSEDIDGDGTNDPIMGIIPQSVNDNSKNDWVITEGIQLDAGTTYEVEIKYNTFDIAIFTSNESFDLVMLDQQASTAPFSSIIGSYSNITEQGSLGDNTGNDLETQAYVATESFTPTTSGNYFIGMHTNNSTLGPVLIFSIAVNEVCPAPTNITLDNSTAQTAEISWTENGMATEWNITYGNAGFNPSTGGTTINDNDGTPNAIIPGLTADTSYDIYIEAVCSTTDSALSSPINFTTPIACDAPTNGDAINISSTSAEITWTENGTATEWELIYDVTGFDPLTDGTIEIDNDGIPGLTISGLTNDTKYDVYLRSVCSQDVSSELLGPIIFTTTDLGIASQTLNTVKVYPNPAKNELQISSGKLQDQIQVYNLLGQKVLTKTTEQLKTNLNISSLESGIYLVKATIGENTKTFKVIKE